MDLPYLVTGPRRADDPALGSELPQHGAVLVRGSGLRTALDFERWLEAGRIGLLEYDYGSTPRSRIGSRVYTSTEYPAHQHIPQHNEMAYTTQWPQRLWLFCEQAAARGGETPLADAREVLRKLSPSIQSRFEERGVLYVRSYNLGVDLTWQQAFGTQDRREVERRGIQMGLELAWGEDDRLTTRQRAQATTRHPITGEAVWFNQAHLFHISALEPALREVLLATFGERDLPRNAYYGDGSPIEDSVLDEIRGIYAELQRSFDWQPGDVLVVDNVRTTHGRAPFQGPRKVLVAMSELGGQP